MKLTLVLLLVLGLTLCLAQDANNTKKAHPLVNRTDDNKTHPVPPPHHPRHPPHPRPHHKQNETNTTAPAEPEPEAEAANTTNTTDDSAAARLLTGKRNAGDHKQKDHKAPGKHLRGHHEKPAEANNATNVTKPEENNESEEAQVNEEESAVAEQGEDAEEAEEAARLLADKKVRKNKRVAPRRGHKKNGKRHHEVGENAEGVIGGEDAEDIEHELRRLLPQVHQGNNKKKQVHAKRPQWKKPAHVKPELKPEDFDFFGEHHIFGEDAFENGEGFGFDWNHHNKTH